MVIRPPLEPEDVARLVASTLRVNPKAAICAVRHDGLMVTMPASVPVDGHPLLQMRSAVDVVAPSQHGELAAAWDEVIASRVSKVQVTLIDGSDAVFHFIDARPLHGVLLAVLASEGDLDSLRRAQGLTIIRPRVAKLTRNDHARVVEADTAAMRMLGLEEAELLGQRSLDLVHPEDHARAIDSWFATITTPDVTHRLRCRYRTSDTDWLWVEVSNTTYRTDGGDILVATELVDVSEEMAAHEAVRTREQLLHRLTETLPSGVVQIDGEGAIVHKNDRTAELVGNPAATTLLDQFAWCDADGKDALRAAIDDVLSDGLDADLELTVTDPARVSHRVCHVALRALTTESGIVTGAICSISDVTQSTVLREELSVRATFDDLTGCHNRASVMTLLETHLEEWVAVSGLAVMFIDLDEFKPVNDRLGHAAGDHVLKVTAERLRAATRGGDVVGRVGGDEFLVLCPELPDYEDALHVAQRIADRLREPIDVDGTSVPLRASLGFAWSDRVGLQARELVAAADAAMYESKRLGTGQPVASAPITA